MKMRQIVALVLMTALVLLFSACQQGVTQQEDDYKASELANAKTELETLHKQLRDLQSELESAIGRVPTGAQRPVLQGEELLETAGDLWDSLADAKADEDPEALYRLLSFDLRERCSVDDVEEWLPNAGLFLFFEGVMTVFLDAADPHRAVAEMAGGVLGPGGEEGTMSVLMPMVWEDRAWRLVLPMDDSLGKSCPFAP